ncbi:MAG: sugar phosphate nucleotidyltransferase [bacterium]
MKAIIIAGGLGTRLRPLTCTLPKPMVPVANHPILEHTIQLLKKHKISNILFLLYYLPESIRSYFGDGSKFGVKTSFLVATEDYGTAGAVKLGQDFVDKTCLIVSGDALTDLDVTRFLEFHKKKRAALSIALSRQADPTPYGTVITDRNQRITRFLEKPAWGQVFSDTVNMGIYLIEPKVLDMIPPEKEMYFAKDLFPDLLEKGKRLYGYVHDGYWRDVGDLKTYLQVSRDLPLAAISSESDVVAQVMQGKNCTIGNDVTFSGSVLLGEGCTIDDGVRLKNVVIGAKCKISKNTSIKNAVLWDEVSIGSACELNQNVIANDSTIADNVHFGEYAFVGAHAKIGANCHINANVKIWPYKEVEFGSVVNSSVVWAEKWHRGLFVESRVSGLANLEISPEFGAKLGAAFGTWIGKKGYVMVSRDASPAARMVYRSMISGLMSTGVHVVDLQAMPIPVVRYTLQNLKNQGGLHIRRSPFDKELMDILFFDAGGKDFSPGATRAIERIYFQEDFPRVTLDEVGDIDYPIRVTQTYGQDFLNHIDIAAIESAQPKIVIDYSYGAATQVFPSILGSLACEVISLNAFLEPKKLTRSAHVFRLALNQLSKIVKSTGSDVGFLIDAGAEKVFCVDETGTVIPSPRLAILITQLFLKTKRSKKIAAPVSVPSQIEMLARKYRSDLVCTPESHGALIKAASSADVTFAVDSTGGYIFPDFHLAFDGMYSVVKILEMLAQTDSSLAALNAELPLRSFVESRVACPWEAKGRVMRKLDRDSEKKQRVLVDGVKIVKDDGWVLVLPDREKAFYHILAEAKTQSQAEKLAEEYKTKVMHWVAS